MVTLQNEAGTYRQVGPHQVRVELPDVLHIRLGGDVEREHFKVFFDTMEEQITPPTRAYVLRDARNGGLVKRDAREYISKKVDLSRVAAIVTYGASFHTRTVLMMVNKAMRLFTVKVPEIVFFDDEEQARAWIKNHRDKHK